MSQGFSWISCTLAVLLLGGVATEWQVFHGEYYNADGYQAHVREIADALPYRSGDWLGQDVPPVAEAVAMLHPNVIMERYYRNISSGLGASFLLVQCGDARDLYGHYPPVCYVAHGSIMVGNEPYTCTSGELTIEGRMYQFSSDKLARKSTIDVFDFMILPNGRLASDMKGVDSIARDRHIRHFGAAQIQVVTDAQMTENDRRAAIETLLSCAQPVIQTIRAGVPQ